jgi:hypothetical protein
MADGESPRDEQDPYDSPPPIEAEIVLRSGRPASAIVFGILNLLYAVFGLCGFGAWIVIFVTHVGDLYRDPAAEPASYDQALYVFNLVFILVGFAASIVLAIAGVGLLQFRPWGRTLSILYAGYGIVAVLVSIAVAYVFHYRPVVDATIPEPVGSTSIGEIVFKMLIACIGLVYPTILYVFMRRREFAASLRRAQG